MIYTLTAQFPTKVSHKKGTIIAKAGDKVKLISLHGELAIIETGKGDRITIQKHFLQ